ncbi:MAG: hypothetical protein B6I37_07900 [Desulfobacteraceae bacterium 4572_35.2]|nr:MAG: hypothetical protein B6I37_07900 [Desulfobacteraceae bacterium 4572_35.2]
MSKLRKAQQHMAHHCCSTHSKGLFVGLSLLIMLLGGAPSLTMTASAAETDPDFPLNMEQLLSDLSDAHQPELNVHQYPRSLEYHHQRWNVVDDRLVTEQVTLTVDHKPQRIIPHAVGLTEVLWAITEHERIASVHETCRNPSYSFLADQLPDSVPTYGREDTEIVIGLCPDLVLTTYYSSSSFKNRLTLSHIPFIEMGFFGNITSIERQINFIGKLVDAETSAQHLVTTMQNSVVKIQEIVKQRLDGKPLRVLYYDRMGFVAGENSTFDSLCNTLGVENVATQNGIKFFKQIGYETVLMWDPDIIIIPEDSGLDKHLLGQPILASAKAVRNKNIRTIPSVYLMASSQYTVASLNYLGGVLYEK